MIRNLSLFLMLASPVAAEPDFDTRVMDTILRNPEVILLAIEKLKQEEATKHLEEQQSRIHDLAEDLFGDGTYSLVEFADYRCGYCAQNAKELQLLTDDDLKRIKIVELPILGAQSEEIAKVALGVKAVAGEEAYRAFHFAVFAGEGRVRGTQSALALAAKLGHDPTEIETESNNERTAQKLVQNRNLARTIGVTGTPAFISADGLHEGLMPLETIRAHLKKEEDPT